MNKTKWLLWTAIAAAMVLAVPGAVRARQQTDPATPGVSAPETVPQILAAEISVTDAVPPVVTIHARGQVNSGGWSAPRLVKTAFGEIPADGIQDFEFIATPPSGPATAALQEIEAEFRWDTVLVDAPWLRGIRVHGADEAPKEVLLEPDQRAVLAKLRAFTGVSESGSFEGALEQALSQMNAASAEGGVADGMVTWVLGPVSGRVGGFAGFNELQVVIYVSRTPPWTHEPEDHEE
jgi:hypothetical protein